MREGYAERISQLLEKCNAQLLSMKRDCDGYRLVDDIHMLVQPLTRLHAVISDYLEEQEKVSTANNSFYTDQVIEDVADAFVELYNLQDDPADPAMLLMIDYDVFYEFIPLEEVGMPEAKAIPLWKTETGKNYAIIISTSCGLWRYQIGDTVKFTSKNPYKFIISGRTKSFINAFGEELMVDNAEKGLDKACKATGAQVLEYTAAPVFMDIHGKCRHQWLIEFSKQPDNLEQFAEVLDKALQEINSDYEAKRSKDITLQRLEITEARPGLFNDWLRSKGKLGGQHKVPRLNNSRNIIEEILALNGGK